MCLIVAAWRMHPRYRLVLAGNRDEFHARAAEPAAWWPDAPGLAAGRDVEGGGTWLGLSRDKRFGVVTNYREGPARGGERSRGLLLRDYLAAPQAPSDFAAVLRATQDRYAGFNLLFGDRERFFYHTNRSAASRELGQGIHGVSNALLNTPWPKLVRTRERLAVLLDADALAADALLEILADREPAETGEPLDTDLDPALHRLLSAPFILSRTYGTRCSTAVLVHEDGAVEFVERRFDPQGETTGETRLGF